MIKAFCAVVVSAIAAGCFVAFPVLSAPVHATLAAQKFAPTSLVPPAATTTCGQNAWPYLDAACLHNATGSATPREVRFVSADRQAN